MLSHRVPRSDDLNAWSRAVTARRAQGASLIDLTETNPTRVGLSPLAEAAATLAAVPHAGYAPEARGARAAREAVSAYYASRGVRVDADELVLTASTSESYAHLFRLLADPGECVVAPAPSYPLFEPLARAEGLELRSYRLRFDGGWHLDRDSLERVLPGARAVIVVEPNHPTGSVLDREDRAYLEGAAERHACAIVADEVFGDVPRPPASAPLPTWIGERRVPTFVLGGLSKLCGLPHLKLGWIALAGPPAARREALAGLEWLADLFLSVATPVQTALPGLLELRAPFAARVRERLATNLGALAPLVRACPGCSVLPADGGWSVVLRVPATRNDEAWALALLEAGVVAHPGHFYDFETGEHLVLSLIVEPPGFAAGVEVSSRVLAGA